MLYYAEIGLSPYEVPEQSSICIYISGCLNNCRNCHYSLLQQSDYGDVLIENFGSMSIVGVEEKSKSKQIVSEETSPRFLLCVTTKNAPAEILEITHAVANTFQNFCFIIAALNKAIRPGNIKRIQNLVKPVAIRFGTICEFR